MMASKRSVSKSVSPQQIDNDTLETQSESQTTSHICRTCGDTARIINYGALSCQSCKTFFRRNGFRPESVRPCLNDNSCEVNMQTRQNCAACRLAKCFRMGMTSDLIRKEDRKKVKNSSPTISSKNEQIISSKSTTVSQLRPLDLLQGDRSLLTNSEWTLLSNIIHAHDTYSTTSQAFHNIESLCTLPNEMHLVIINPLEIISQMYTSMQSFISSSPDFRILTLDEQTSLFDRNLYGTTGFYSTLFFRNTGILHDAKSMEAFIKIYGSEMMLSMINIDERLDPDSTLIKLILIIFAFSSNCLIAKQHGNKERDSLLYGTFRLLGSQNVYMKLLWKYMIYRYGYAESAIRFARLIQIFSCVLKNLANIYMNNEAHQNIIHDIIEKTKKSLTIDNNEQTLLWGKT